MYVDPAKVETWKVPSPEKCFFPTTTRRTKEFCNLDVVKLGAFGNQNNDSGIGLNKCRQELLRAAWAVLLRNYVGKLSISFGVISKCQFSNERQCQCQTGCFNSDLEIQVHQYQIPATCFLEDIHGDRCWAFPTEDLEQTRINTAIHFGELDENNAIELGTDYLSVVNSFDLILQINPLEYSIEGALRYRADVISAQYAQTIANSLQTIWNDALMGLPMEFGLNSSISYEDQQKVVSWNPKALYSQMACMHHLVEAAVRAAPQAEAVHAWDGSLTYFELNTLSSVVAHKLGQFGVGPGVYVPFAFEKSLWTVVATLGILKSGAAFVPLDPTQPTSRLEEILASINAEVVVTSTLFASKFSNLGMHVVEVSAFTIPIHKTKGTNIFVSTAVRPNDPIFVLFTSGSTGKPKGIVHEHGAICTHAITHGEVMGYQGARVLQFAAHTFDVAIIDIFTTLIYGGCICIPSEEERKSNIIAAINRMKADYAILTPSFARLIKPSEVPTLKTLAVGGEALPQDGLRQWFEQVSVIQIYGPAEVGICLSIKMCLGKTRAETVGTPLPNCSCWLVDPDEPHRLVPIGAVGELVVTGPSLAREYLNDETRTESSLLKNPLWARSLKLDCTKFFRTGDLLRYNTESYDGSFDFVGRKDVQIKLRGQRIEPGEIEHHMASIPGVAISMVTQPMQGCFKGQLVVIVEMQSSVSSHVRTEPVSLTVNQSLALEDVQKHLSKVLPSYMIPTMCLVIKNMPFVPSLKIDRNMVNSWLGSMASAPAKVAEAIHANLRTSPLNQTELTAGRLSIKVAEILASSDWQRRIALENHDFVLQAAGIDSIQLISLYMFLERAFRVHLPISRLLSSTITIRELADIVDNYNKPGHETKLLSTVDIVQKCEILISGLFEKIQSAKSLNFAVEEKTVSVHNILVTGASGYLGSAILNKLMERPQIKVIALVRCTNESLGLKRIIDTCKMMRWWRDCYMSRIEIWKGDLTQEDLGLNKHQLECLNGSSEEKELHIHGIIHNGAQVHYSSDYETLENVNITSTLCLLYMTAMAPQISNFVFVSGGQRPDDRLNIEDFSESERIELNQANGYTQTKLSSEFLVRKSNGHNLFIGRQLHIIKPGYIIGSAELGLANQRDFIWRIISGCLEIGAYNQEEAEHWLFIADVGHVADHVISPLFDVKDSNDQPRVVSDGLRFSELWELLGQEFGYELEAINYQEWIARLKRVILKKQEGHLLFPLIHILEREGGLIGSSKKPAGLTTASSKRVRDAVRSNIKHLIDIGFMPKARF